MNRFDIPEDTFIGGWFLPDSLIDKLNNYYEDNISLSGEGVVGQGNVDKEKKDSNDLGVNSDDYSPPFDEFRYYQQKVLENYIGVYNRAGENQYFTIVEGYNFQNYPIGGGFKIWHHENTGYDRSIKRHLAWMTFLNDVDDGGTDFMYQKLTIPAKKGLTLIWPVHWTHTHKGQISNTKEKRIITGWYNFTTKEETK